jgi:hypothetical protein
MITLRRSVGIDSPTDQVFTFMLDPDHLHEIWPSLVDVTNVRDRGTGANSFDFVYKMAGIKLHGHSGSVEVEPGRCVLTTLEGGITGKLRWSFDGKDGHTDVTVEAEYAIPVPVLGRLAEPIVAKINEHEAEVLLKNLKARMEDLTEAALAT